MAEKKESETMNIKECDDDNEPTLSSRSSSMGREFEEWLAMMRRRNGKSPAFSIPRRSPAKIDTSPAEIPASSSFREEGVYSEEANGSSGSSQAIDQAQEMSLWDRLGNAAMLDIEANDFSWDTLRSLYHVKYSSAIEQPEDDLNKALEVTVNSGGLVFFALFSKTTENDYAPKEAAAVIKIAPSRMATQSERLGYEFANLIGTKTPQARVIHNCCTEWQRIKDAVERTRDIAVSGGDEAGELACSEVLEALELSRCLLLLNYIHGLPLLENPIAFESREAAEHTAAALGRVMMLDLVLRNEDRLRCRQLGWRGNYANIYFADKLATANIDVLDESNDSGIRRYQPLVLRSLEKERRAISVSGRLGSHDSTANSDASDASPDVNSESALKQSTDHGKTCNFHIVVIDSVVPRRPPAGKRAKDQENYPKVVELILNNYDFSSNFLFEVSVGRLGSPGLEDTDATTTEPCTYLSELDMVAVTQAFRGGFRAALRDLQGFHLFLLTLYQKIEGLSRIFISLASKTYGESDKDEPAPLESPLHSSGCSFNSQFSVVKERGLNETNIENSDNEIKRPLHRSSGSRENFFDISSPVSRENWNGRYFKGSAEPLRNMRLTMRLRDFVKLAKVDAEISKELEQWNEMFKTDVLKLCQENNFNPGFFEGNDCNMAIDAYELKVRLEHILERISLISDAANTERPSLVLDYLYIGGALAAKSLYTLRHLKITHILCLCANEIGQSDTQYSDLFEYRNFSVTDSDDEDISALFEETSDFIDHVQNAGGKVLVHCFEGRSRSATVVLAYLILRKNLTLLQAWSMLKKVHRRAQPNDGFAKTLLDLDKHIHGKTSMEWQHKKPTMKVCPICGKNAGLSSSSLQLHLQKSHKKSSGSVDSAMTLEIQKAVEALKVSRSNCITPTQKQGQSLTEGFFT